MSNQAAPITQTRARTQCATTELSNHCLIMMMPDSGQQDGSTVRGSVFDAAFDFCHDSKSRQTNAAMSPPTMGATQNNQSWLKAVPPTTTAGPKLLAGFTDVPVIGIPMR